MDDLLRDFLTESSENLLRIEQEMVELEQRPEDEDLLGSIFRSMHTIKGTCGFLGLARLEAVAHSAENVLGSLRDGELSVSDGLVSDVLAAVDTIRSILEGLEETEEEPIGDDSDLVERLHTWIGDDGERTEESLDALFAAAKQAVAEAAAAEEEEAASSDDAESVPDATEDEVGGSGTADELEEPVTVDAVVNSQPDVSSGSSQVQAPKANAAKSGRSRSTRSVADATLRVDVDVLDRLMNLAGELVLTRNQLNQLVQRDDDSDYASPVQHLNRVTTDLQEAVMKTRMQPIGNAWSKLPRLVRDLSNASGKSIDLVMIGAETELDRQILQAIKDPLTHMIRNSADHGIESAEVRVKNGKSEGGEIVLEAFHEGGHIVIEIRDDGKGLDVEAIRSKAIERGLVSEAEASDLSDHRMCDFIFQAGFSTAKQVTAVSGRGVGMDVVRRNIEEIGGTVEVRSTPGEGTTLRIKIPLTLAIMSALIVGVRGQSFAVPQIGVLELVRIGEGNEHLIENVSDSQFYRLRDQLLPLVRLDTVLGLPTEDERVPNILVCQVGASRFGLIVDAILDTHEIVVKPVGRLVKGVRAYTGTTILGDGRVIMILDVPGIAQTTEVLAHSQGPSDADAAASDSQSGTSLLVFDAGVAAPRAVPLSQVARLEEFALADIEWVDSRWVVQYRDELLPLLPASEGIQMSELDPRPVIVFSDGEMSMGLAVDHIQDIIQEEVKVRSMSHTEGLIGSIVVAGRATELIDIDYYLAKARNGSTEPPLISAGRGAGYGGGAQAGSGYGAAAEHQGRKILLVDDSPFFLNMLGPLLRSHGFDVSVSHDGRHALSRLERGEQFDAVVSDIDMPNMDGFELARRVREAGQKDLPMIALTSRTSEKDRAHGLEVGFNHYLMKFDQAQVVAAVRAIFDDMDAELAPEEVLS